MCSCNYWSTLTYNIYIQKILESWATPNWSEWPVGQEEFRSQIPSPRSSIPDPESQIFHVRKINLVEFFFPKKKLGQKKIEKKGSVKKKFPGKKKIDTGIFSPVFYFQCATFDDH